MANINNDFSDYNKFYIQYNNSEPLQIKNLIRWEDYGLDSARNLKYHGTLESVSKPLTFINEERRYIEAAYKNEGVLAKLKLIRLQLKVVKDDVSWIQDDAVFADFETMTIKDKKLTINFYSNSLMEIITAHESDEFEIERLETVDNKVIEELEINNITLKGRSMVSAGQFKPVPLVLAVGSNNVFLKTETISQGPDRQSFSELTVYNGNNVNNITDLALFYDNSVADVVDVVVDIVFDLDVTLKNTSFTPDPSDFYLSITKVLYDSVTASYSIVERVDIASFLGSISYEIISIKNKGALSFNLTKDEGLGLEFRYIGENGASSFLKFNSTPYFSLSEVQHFEQSVSKFVFYYDLINRLMNILTGSTTKFVSNYLGRKENGYVQDGEGSFIGFLSGMWVRQFAKDNKNYKSPVMSLKDALTSISNCFSLGYGVETIHNEEKLVLEPLIYFYRDEVVGVFPQQINNEKFTIDKKSYYSSLAFGYKQSGGVSQKMGLDEPNIKSKFITPVKTAGKFTRDISVRADEYKLEDLRRTPALNNPDKSMSGDEHNWFIDLKRSSNPLVKFEQLHWSDKLDKAPTGIHDPESFRSFRFTPATILRRFASNFNSGLYLYPDKFINFISGSPNVKLSMKYTNESKEYKENDNVLIGDLRQPIFKNEIIKFTHPWSSEVENLIFGKTEIVINGQKRMIPNFYFKMQFINSKNEIVSGYYLKHEFSDNPTFEFQLSNEEII